MARKKKWFAFYPSDWITGVEQLNLEEVGAYIQIIARLYECDNCLMLDRIEHPVTGKLEKYSYKGLARALNTRSDKLERIVNVLLKKQKLHIMAGALTSHRVAVELAKVEMISKRNRENVSKRRDRQHKNIIKFNRMDDL